LTGWWLTYPSEKYYIVSWDDDSQYGKTKHVPNHQPVDIYKNLALQKAKNMKEPQVATMLQ